MDRNKQDYTPEFRGEAVKVALAQGLSLAAELKHVRQELAEKLAWSAIS
jgi:hypothetical protein